MIYDSLQSYWRGEKAFGDASSSSLTVLLVLSLLYAVMPFTPFREEAGAAEGVFPARKRPEVDYTSKATDAQYYNLRSQLDLYDG